MKNCCSYIYRRAETERKSGFFAALGFVALAMGLLGCASSPPTESKQTSNRAASAEQPRPTRSAGPPASVDMLLAESLRQYVNQRDATQAMGMAQLAVKRAPERADALWILLQICSGTQGCQPEPLEAQLRKLDPGNGIVWLGALSRANARGDTAAADQILEAIGRGARVDLGWNALVVKLATAIAERTRATTPDNKAPLGDALNEAVGLLSSIALPALQPVADSCSSRRVIDRLVSARCLLASAALQRSDTYAAESIGLGIAQRLSATDTVETSKVEQRIVSARYQRDTAGEIMTTAQTAEKERFAAELVDLMRKQRREQDVFLAIIRWAGRPLTPVATR